MNLQFWKHKRKNVVIKQECYDKLPNYKRTSYSPTEEEPTHSVNDTDFSTSLLSSSLDTSSSSSDGGFNGFDDGSGGGGGADSGW